MSEAQDSIPSARLNVAAWPALAAVLDRFVVEARAASDLSALRRCLPVAVAAFGFDRYLYLSTDAPFTHPERPFALSNLPHSWLHNYLEDAQYLHDPTLRVAMNAALPIAWDAIRQDRELTRAERTFLDRAESDGFGHGLTVPVHGPGALRGVLNLGATNIASPDQTVFAQLLALQTHDQVLRLFHGGGRLAKVKSLTAREIECLVWAARGKTSWQTALILDVAEPTINFHINNSMRKLSVFSRTHAVAKAVALGLIYV